MAMKIKITLNRQAASKVREKFKELVKIVEDPSPANKNVSKWLFRWVDDNFKSEGEKVGGWEPFKYGGRVVSKAKGDSQSIVGRNYLNTSAQLLQDTGLLRASFESFHSKKEAGIGSWVEYSIMHELGSPLNNVPARRMLPSRKDKDVSKAVIKIYDAYIKKAKRKD